MRFARESTLQHPLNTPADYETIAESLKASYRTVAPAYRRDDEIEITTDHHRHLKSILGAISSSFGRSISVLDAGCGTGRYFHCLKNVDRLVGIDLSEAMLEIAGNPVRKEEVSARNIELECGNIHLASFPSQSFDFIYSLGMFGNGCPVTVDLCNRFHDWLAPGGQLFFDAVDLATLPFSKRLRRKVREAIHPFLPRPLRKVLDKRREKTPFFGLDRRGLERIMRSSRFTNFSVSSHCCLSPLWQGFHLECAASKAFMMWDSSKADQDLSPTPPVGA